MCFLFLLLLYTATGGPHRVDPLLQLDSITIYIIAIFEGVIVIIFMK